MTEPNTNSSSGLSSASGSTTITETVGLPPDAQLEALVADAHRISSVVAQKQREFESYSRQLTIVKQRILARNAVLQAAAKARK